MWWIYILIRVRLWSCLKCKFPRRCWLKQLCNQRRQHHSWYCRFSMGRYPCPQTKVHKWKHKQCIDEK